MAKVVVSDLAADNLAHIWTHVGQDDPVAADRLIDAFFDQFEVIGKHPLLGERRHDLGPDVRQSLLRPYVVLYRLRSGVDAVDILTIIHGARDVEAAFRAHFPRN